MNVNDYIREAKRQLNDPKNYKVLAKDPTTTNNDLVNQTIDRFTKEELVNESIVNWLKNPSPRTPQFYISPKIHKEGNPVRPVVSSINFHTANISMCRLPLTTYCETNTFLFKRHQQFYQ